MMNNPSPQDRKLNGEDMNKVINFDTKEENLHYEGVFDIDPKELHEKMEKVTLVDVRQPEEYHGDLGHIPNSELVVLDTLAENLEKLNKEDTIVFVCRSGSRSARACAFALQNGFKHVYNLKGGMILWNELHFETEA